MNIPQLQQQQPSSSDGFDFLRDSTSVSLRQRLQALDEVDKKIAEIMDSTRDLIITLDKDKQISRTKMDENAKKYTKVLEEDIMKVISDQLTYMEQLCVGAEHQDSMFRVQNKNKMTKEVLNRMYTEVACLQTLVANGANEDGTPDGNDVEMIQEGSIHTGSIDSE
ncbi:unnamed protein product [Bursaphelenchus okinawaensis]|uniref:Mediator of RNA polymerase II transcription subunit 11 n=1 Tax=Bursaphelenchus okinawaensis TaxID=465554 RepID=A0A811K421_9BILA|nr:unnamed protein product [Bursaphelenchus okinawaensis]CAG9091877.1 unnamed protein product [Bursaphelenchus okinawaensis]